MSPELRVLAYAGLLLALQYVAYSIAGNRQVGPRVAMGPRDKPVQLTGTAGRLQRALVNHIEGLTLFTLATVVLTVGDRTTGFSALCAWTYLAARALYIPAYVFGLAPWRSLIWFVGFTATVLMLLSALVF